MREQILTDDTEAESESGEEDGAKEGLIGPATQFGLKQLDLKLMLEQRKYEQVGMQLAHQERPPTNSIKMIDKFCTKKRTRNKNGSHWKGERLIVGHTNSTHTNTASQQKVLLLWHHTPNCAGKAYI